ncbi:serine protease, partial [Sphaerisporangium sp. NPDC049002]|uniref:trypsin-like serine peptidase n=1 Tax=Sphaerisporangium sp. NPDC049002 TaxID=3155392 RepID=UPI0033D5FA55
PPQGWKIHISSCLDDAEKTLPSGAGHAVTRNATPSPLSLTSLTSSLASSLASTGVVQHVAARSGAEQRRVLGYWTARRMARALPAGVPSAVAKIGELASGVRRPSAVPASSASGASAPGVNISGARWAAGGAVRRTTGRVFLTLRGLDYVCSASSVRSRNLDVVVTAGHCAKDGSGPWAENWTFVPAYEPGRQPYGVFTARRMLVPEPWSESGDDSYDVGMIAVNPSGGLHLNEAVGGQEIGFGVPRGGRAFGFGFPADPPYDGRHLIYCAGDLHHDPHGQTRDQGMRCDLTAGSSGGPWLSSFDPETGQGVVTSVSSFKYSDDDGTMYGPYFGDQARRLFDLAQRA